MTLPINSRDKYLQDSLIRTVDNGLLKEEKSGVISRYNSILQEQITLDAQATSYGITTQKTAYDTAITALTTYLATLTVPVLWNDNSNLTVITRTTFNSKFTDIDIAKKNLQTAINTSVSSSVDAVSSGLSNKLNKAAADALSGPITISTGGAVVVGTAAMTGPSSFSGTGIVVSPSGIAGIASGVPSFSITSAGVATFAGNLSAATGTFSGNANGTINGTSAATVVSNAAQGPTGVANAASAQSTANSKLNKGAADSLSGAISIISGGSIVVGTAAMTGPSSFSGTGIVVSPSGIAGITSGTPNFYITSSGTATFSGTVQGATIIGSVLKTSTGSTRVAIGESPNMMQYFIGGASVCEIGGTSGIIWATSSSFLSAAISGTSTGPLAGVVGTGSSGPGVYASANSGSGIEASSSTGYAIKITGGFYGIVQTGGGICWLSGLNPSSNNAYSLGSADFVWTSVWATNGTIQTSDIRTKINITNSDLGLDFINRLRPVSYLNKIGSNTPKEELVIPFKDPITTYKPKPGERKHYGLIAQEVKDALGSDNIAMWVLSDKEDNDSQQALIYTELIAPMIKAIQELSAQVQDLKAKLK